MNFIPRTLLRTAGLLTLALLLTTTQDQRASAAERIVAYTAYLPPLSIDKVQKGIATELMELVGEEADLEMDFRFAPWKRAQVLAENTPGSLIFTIAYSKARADRFQYIAPLIFTESAFISLDDSIDSFEQVVAAGKMVGVHLGSQRSKILKREGVEKFIEVSSAEQMATMLKAGRIDTWYTMNLRAVHIFKKMGYDSGKLVIGAPVSHGVQWLAANKSLDPKIRARLAKAISKVRRDPRFWEIVDRYSG
ncbi:substrate-binding periplasmic protein [Roseibium aggregatum]|uniref:substrate-binding periplasmic protein n=1 Tax=Roseibium aggregatum TaxID=187304 RepID=UPI001AD8CB51|nr:transporter substrate-binding domain-containing protein [Roseibium aggregatum]